MFNRPRNNRTGPNPAEQRYNYQREAFDRTNNRPNPPPPADQDDDIEAAYRKYNSKRPVASSGMEDENKARFLYSFLKVQDGKMGMLFDRGLVVRTAHPTILHLPEHLLCNEKEAAAVAMLLQRLCGFFVEPSLPHGYGHTKTFYVYTNQSRLFNGRAGHAHPNPFAIILPDGWLTRLKKA